VNEIKDTCQHRTNSVKGEKGNILVDPIRYTAFCIGGRINCQLINVHRIQDARQKYMHLGH